VTRKLGLVGSLFVAGALFAAGCGSKDNNNPPPVDQGVKEHSQSTEGGTTEAGKSDGAANVCEAACQAKAKYYCVSTGKNDAGGLNCVECTTNAHCKGNPYAYGTVCTSTNLCSCSSNADCATSPRGALCDTSNEMCYCKANADCKVGSNTLCDTTQGSCVKPCKADGDCTASSTAKYCNTVTQLCNSTKMCNSDSECTDKTLKYCNTKTKTCQSSKPCASNTDCTTSSRPVCQTSTGKCVECAASTDCKTNQYGGLCSSNVCTCAANSDCSTSSGYPWGNSCITPSGSSTKRCGCSANSDCGGNPNGQTCYTTYSKCSCSTDAGCTKSPWTKCALPYSGASYSNCQKPCTGDTDCKTKDANEGTGLTMCNGGKCVECKSASDCHYSTPVCSSQGSCVECAANGDCPKAMPYCDTTKATCFECKANSDCTSSTSGAKCDTTTGACTCSANSDCTGQKAFGPTCDTTTYMRCKCGSSSDCSSNANGPTCNTTYYKCSCSSDSNCTKTPYTKCSLPYSGASYDICQAACTSAKDCDYTQGFYTCQTSTGKCFECLQNSDCSANTWSKVCDTTSTFACVECMKDADCTTASFGNKCDTTYGACACAKDADCTSNQNGKVCDTSYLVCSCAGDSDCPTNKKCTGNALYYYYCQ
jgi:hypothetical protein